MATKKCPKCGEENPAEAVMCWACYTPLAGGAAAVAGGGLVTPRGGAAAVTPAATAGQQDEEKKPIDPKIFLVIGLLAVAGVIGIFTSGVLSGGGDDSGLPLPVGPAGASIRGSGGGGGTTAPPIDQRPSFPTTTGGGTTGGGTTGVKPPPPPPFKMVIPPDPNYSSGTMGIMSPTPNISPVQAIALAKHAKQMISAGGNWTVMQVVVFNDPAAAGAFRKYQANRKGAKLTGSEYRELAGQGLWINVPAFYESNGKGERAYNPSANPNGWWTGDALR